MICHQQTTEVMLEIVIEAVMGKLTWASGSVLPSVAIFIF